MSLAIFDLDNTLIGGDSDYLWGRFLVEQAVVDGEVYEAENERYYQAYKEGTLDIMEFLRFSLKPLSEHSPETLYAWRTEFIQRKIRPILLPKAFELLDRHRQAGDSLMIITATNRFVTEPIAELLGVKQLLATDPEMAHGRYTGGVSGIPCFQDGKVKRLEQWLQQTGNELKGSYFYSDSHNDLPLLERVDHPVAVDADDALVEIANARAWPIICLRAS